MFFLLGFLLLLLAALVHQSTPKHWLECVLSGCCLRSQCANSSLLPAIFARVVVVCCKEEAGVILELPDKRLDVFEFKSLSGRDFSNTSARCSVKCL
jgi:hypothetical protein